MKTVIGPAESATGLLVRGGVDPRIRHRGDVEVVRRGTVGPPLEQLNRTGRDVVVGDQTAASPDTGVGVAARRDRRQADRRVREVVARVVEGREMKGVAVTGADALDDDGPRAVARREHQPPHEGRAERGQTAALQRVPPPLAGAADRGGVPRDR